MVMGNVLRPELPARKSWAVIMKWAFTSPAHLACLYRPILLLQVDFLNVFYLNHEWYGAQVHPSCQTVFK